MTHQSTGEMTEDGHVETVPFTTDEGLGTVARIGAIVLQSDQTLEHEFAQVFRVPGVALYHSRIPNAMDVTPDTLGDMEAALPVAAELLAPSFDFDAIGYGCTSGATIIGEARVAEIINRFHPTAKVSNPITATKAALNALEVKRIALVTPYSPTVTLAMQANFNAAGIETAAVASFNESDDFTVARISCQSILDAVVSIGERRDCDAVFVSCTNLRALDTIAQAEDRLGKPVLASNQALAWHLMQLCGLKAPEFAPGRIFQIL